MPDFEFPKVAGCDCGKNSLTICLLDALPSDFKSFCRKNKPIEIKADREGVETLLAISADIFALEPTGSYSRLWIEILGKANKDVRLVNSSRVKFAMLAAGVTNKSDKIDSAGIALYTLQNWKDPSAFLSPSLKNLREVLGTRRGLVKNSVSLKNRIGSRLAYEYPEGSQPWEDYDRKWGKGSPVIIRAIAGVDPQKAWVKKRIKAMATTIGSGVSPTTTQLVQQLHQVIGDCQQLEQEIDLLLAKPELERYNQVLDQFLAPNSLRAAIIPCIYPFERFLHDGMRIVEYVTGANGKSSKRDRSEGAFKLSVGMGRVQYQSGSIEKWRAGGPKHCRISIWQYIKTIVVMSRVDANGNNQTETIIKRHHQGDIEPWLNPKIVDAIAQATNVPKELAGLRAHYQCSSKSGTKRDMSTASRFARMLYKALLREFSQVK